MLKPALIQEFVRQNRLPVKRNWEKEVGCIEYSSKPLPLRFPGGVFGIFTIFLSSSQLYGFEIKKEKFLELLPSKPHPKNCFYIKHFLKNAKELFLEEKDLTLSQKLFSPSIKKSEKETVFFLTSGPFHLSQYLEIETDEEKKEIFALTLNLDFSINYLKKLCKKATEKGLITFKFDVDIEYLTEVVLDTFQNHLWEATIKEYSGLPIYKVEFSNKGDFKLKDMGRI